MSRNFRQFITWSLVAVFSVSAGCISADEEPSAVVDVSIDDEGNAASGAAEVTDRTALVPGTYLPGPTTTGPIWTGAFQQMEASSGTTIRLTTPNVTYRRVEFWGTVVPKAKGIKFDECIFRGPDPSMLPETRALLTNFGDNPPHVVIENSLFDPEAWITKRGKSAPAHNGNPAGQLMQSQFGIHGGNFTLRWSEIRNVEDGVNFVGRTADWTNQQTTVEMSWIHAGEYKNGTGTPSDGRTHNDAFQFNAGRNVVLRGNVLGGPRDMVGYRTWPNGYNSGDDYSNASIMFKQEVDDSDMRKLANILIEDNFFWGAVAGLNHHYVASRKNDFATTTIRDNFFVERQMGWGNGLTASEDDHSVGVETQARPSAGWYVVRSPEIRSTYQNNRIITVNEDGSFVVRGEVPISRGSSS
ncbi:hypothetical protein [Sorangium sp. So ce1151]|uniref:hypothetical protein n=1 Tax=Sorangium sp. So ce1151 TaxID=3133332 RepID=UPI003F634CDC